jgi:hypothetical protein
MQKVDSPPMMMAGAAEPGTSAGFLKMPTILLKLGGSDNKLGG